MKSLRILLVIIIVDSFILEGLAVPRMFAKQISIVPDYLITIHLKSGTYKQGVRWHPAYDIEQVQAVVEKKVKATLGMAAVDWIDVKTMGRNVGTGKDTKTL
jgi:hypothetical protein